MEKPQRRKFKRRRDDRNVFEKSTTAENVNTSRAFENLTGNGKSENQKRARSVSKNRKTETKKFEIRVHAFSENGKGRKSKTGRDGRNVFNNSNERKIKMAIDDLPRVHSF